MKVDQKRFFSLVTTLAGMTACGQEHLPVTPELAPLEVAVPRQPPPPLAVSSAPPVAVASVDRAANDLGAPKPALGSATSEGGSAQASVIDQYDPAGKHTCAELRCPPGHPFAEGLKVLRHDCKGLEAGLKPEPFQRFIQCMLRQNNTRATCDLLLVGTDPGECLERWTEPKILDPLTAATCAPVVQRCAAQVRPSYPNRGSSAGGKPAPPRSRALSTSDCQGILTVTKDRVRPKMVACMSEYCEEAPRLCHMNLSYP